MNRIKNVIILAAGRGTRLGHLTKQKPKGMVPLHGTPLLQWHLQSIKDSGISEVVIVGGYRAEYLTQLNKPVVLNPDYATTNMVESLWCAREYFRTEFVMAYSDIVYEPSVLSALLNCNDDIAVVVDTSWRSYWEQRTEDVLDDAESLRFSDEGYLASIGQKVQHIEEIQGQYIGLVKFRGEGVRKLTGLIERERKANARGENTITPLRNFNRLYMTDVLQGLIDEGEKITPVVIEGKWLEIDTLSDHALAEKMTHLEKGKIRINREL